MKSFYLLPVLLGTAACGFHHGYVLSDNVRDGVAASYSGTVLSVEEDGDFIMDVNGRLLFVDYEAENHDIELGDRITVSGVIDNDADEAEAPELDAETIVDWIK